MAKILLLMGVFRHDIDILFGIFFVKIYILGSGGLAREVYGWNLSQSPENIIKIDGFISSDTSSSLYELPIFSKSQIKNMNDNFRFIPCIGDIESREKEFKFLKEIGGTPKSFISDDIKIGANVDIKNGCIINPRSSISSNVTIHEGVIINCNTGIGHDTSIGSFCTIFGSSTINGDVTIGSKVLIGSGVVIHPEKKIGNNAKVGIGSVVIRNIKENTTVFGNPAKNIKI